MSGSLFIGLMSGTSLDGVDAALVDFGSAEPQTVATHYLPFAPELRDELAALQAPGANELHRAALAANRLVHSYAEAVREVLSKASVDASAIAAIGAHGQTVRHCPELGFTLQLNNPSLLAELTGVAVAADFRSRDIAARGQGAPLVPAFHRAVFGSKTQDRVIVNIGGIANLTYLPADGSAAGFDTGPGNALMDGWVERHVGKPFDAGGAWASKGRVIPPLLAQMLEDPYFTKAPPKSTGRDLFNSGWLEERLPSQAAPVDVQATLCALTVRSIVEAINRVRRPGAPLAAFVCGGGAHNDHLMAGLRAASPEIAWNLTDALGVPADWVEAVAFAWLARRVLEREPGNIPAVTGAAGLRVLGAVYPA